MKDVRVLIFTVISGSFLCQLYSILQHHIRPEDSQEKLSCFDYVYENERKEKQSMARVVSYHVDVVVSEESEYFPYWDKFSS